MVSEINQVLLNLIINAAQTIGDVVASGEKEKGTIMISSSQKNGAVVISIKDTGAGIPKNVRNRIFDPFFTTKEIGKGTGQGLAVAYNVVVKKHRGELTFESEEGKGTTFFIQLPETSETATD
jgi:signal transduction histidine kinase